MKYGNGVDCFKKIIKESEGQMRAGTFIISYTLIKTLALIQC